MTSVLQDARSRIWVCGVADCIDFLHVQQWTVRTEVMLWYRKRVWLRTKQRNKKRTRYNDSWSWTQLFGSFFAYLCDRAYCLLGLGEKKASWHLLSCKKFDLCSLVYCQRSGNDMAYFIMVSGYDCKTRILHGFGQTVHFAFEMK